MAMHSRILLGLTWGLVVAYAFVSLFVGQGFALTIFGDISQTVLILLVIAAMAMNAVRAYGAARSFWTQMTIACSLWAAAQVLWSYYELYKRTGVPTHYFGDVLLFLHIVPMMTALLFQPHKYNKVQSLSSISIAMVGSWWLFLYVYLVIPWQYINVAPEIYANILSQLYAIGNVAFLGALALMILRSTGIWHRTYLYLFLATIIYTIDSRVIDYLIQQKVYYTGSIYDLLFLVPVAWLGTTAIIAHKNRSTASGDNVLRTNSDWMDWFSIAILCTVPLLGIWNVYNIDQPREVRDFRTLVVLGALLVLTMLIFLKQVMLKHQVTRALAEREKSFDVLAETKRQLEHRAAHDLMTGTLNRASAIEVLEKSLQHTRVSRPTSVLMIDLDYFKYVNDNFGHQAGDLALMFVTARFKECVRALDSIGRYGGEEFLVVLPDTDEAAALLVAERMRSSICSDPISFNGHVLKVSVTIGVAVADSKESVDSLLRRADLALYAGKHSGRNRVVCYEQRLADKITQVS